MDKRTKNSIAAAAVILLIIALIWKIAAARSSLPDKIAKELSVHGCRINADALHRLAHEKNKSVKQLMTDTDLSKAVEMSRAAGFNSDIEKVGEVYLLLAELNEGKYVLTVFVVDGQIELAFVQAPNSDEVFPINFKYGS